MKTAYPLSKLGQGSYGEVLAVRVEGAPPTALKLVRYKIFDGDPDPLDDRTYHRGIHRELITPKRVATDTVNQLLNVYFINNSDGLHAEVALESTMQDADFGRLALRLPSAQLLRWFSIDILDALDSMHKAGASHRDLKPANILYNALKDRFVISDLGSCSLSATPEPLFYSVCTAETCAPEYFEKASIPVKHEDRLLTHPISNKADVWSFGITLLSGLLGKQHSTLARYRSPDGDDEYYSFNKKLYAQRFAKAAARQTVGEWLTQVLGGKTGSLPTASGQSRSFFQLYAELAAKQFLIHDFQVRLDDDLTEDELDMLMSAIYANGSRHFPAGVFENTSCSVCWSGEGIMLSCERCGRFSSCATCSCALSACVEPLRGCPYIGCIRCLYSQQRATAEVLMQKRKPL